MIYSGATAVGVSDQTLANTGDGALLAGTVAVAVPTGIAIFAGGEVLLGVGTFGVPSATATAAPTIGQIATNIGVNVGDEALVHFGPQGLTTIAPNSGASFWFQFGDISHLTATQVETVIGNLAASGQAGGAAAAYTGATTGLGTAIPGALGFTEYIITVPIKVLVTIPLL